MSIITKDLAYKVLDIVDQGLVKGLGEQIPGKMCVEAAVCFAMGLPHSDKPSCVGQTVREFKIRLNDGPWPSDKDRTKGLRKLAIAQLGSDGIDQVDFSEQVVIETVRQILPPVLTKVGLNKEAKLCSKVTTLEEARNHTQAAYVAVFDTGAYAASYNTSNAAAYHITNVASYSSAGIPIAAAAVDTATIAASYESSAIEKLKIMQLSAQIGLDALIKLKSPGCEFLYLADLTEFD